LELDSFEPDSLELDSFDFDSFVESDFFEDESSFVAAGFDSPSPDLAAAFFPA